MTRYKIIANPVACKGRATHIIPQIEAELKKYSLDFNMEQTQRPWHASEIAQTAIQEGYDILVAAGGDGTINEVINGIMASKNAGKGSAALGVIPIGQGNDFGFSMGLPLGFEESCKNLASGYRRWIDIGHIEGSPSPKPRYFGNGIGIGFDARVAYKASHVRLVGFWAYLYGALHTLAFNYHAYMTQVGLDSETLTDKLAMVSIMNGTRLGGGFMMAPDGKPDDGLFNLNIIHDVNRPTILYLITRFMKGSQYGHWAVKNIQSKKVHVKALEGELPTHGDGEVLSTDSKEITIELLPRQIELISPVL
jgi:diacylglycerol kinase (ATP)